MNVNNKLFTACKDGRLKKVQKLLTPAKSLIFRRPKKGDVNAVDEFGRTPLWCATIKGHTEIAQLLIANGANVNVVIERGRTLLHWASRVGYKDIAELLVANGADVNVADK